MKNKQKMELQILKELLKVHNDPEERKKKYFQISLGLKILAFVVFLSSPYIIKALAVKTMYVALLGFIAGLTLGFGMYYGVAHRQIPFWKKHVKIDSASIQARIKEIKT